MYRRRNRVVIIPLTGGLGNQLFQLAFAIYISRRISLPYLLEQGIAKPRQVAGYASLFQLGIGDIALAESRKETSPSQLISKIYGWNLVNGVYGRYGKQVSFRRFAELLSSVVFSLRVRRWCSIYISSGLGYDEKFNTEKSGGLYIGYFQSFRYAIEVGVFEQLMRLVPINQSQLLEKWITEVEKLRPILLHVRLTDYASENSFGLLDDSYYRDSLNFLKSNGVKGPIWVFSDDKLAAMHLLAKVSEEFDLNFFDSDGLSDVENWYLMRKFSAFVIANSSFSWWAAFLRDKQNSFVCYPIPWFKSQEAPRDLFPDNWIPIASPREY